MKNILTKKSENFSLKKLDWNKVQLDMKEKLGSDIYESWLKKIDFVEEFNNYILISVTTITIFASLWILVSDGYDKQNKLILALKNYNLTLNHFLKAPLCNQDV